MKLGVSYFVREEKQFSPLISVYASEKKYIRSVICVFNILREGKKMFSLLFSVYASREYLNWDKCLIF